MHVQVNIAAGLDLSHSAKVLVKADQRLIPIELSTISYLTLKCAFIELYLQTALWWVVDDVDVELCYK